MKKVCISCLIEKDINQFGKDKYIKGGYRNTCKKCKKLGIKKYVAGDGYKHCNSCKKDKKTKDFYKNKANSDGYAVQCKQCVKAYSEVNSKEYYKKNKKEIAKKFKEDYIKNRKERIEKQKIYYENNKEKIKKYKERYRKNNRSKILNYTKDRKKVDPLFKLNLNIQSLIRIKFRKYLKEGEKRPREKILGCTMEEFKKHIESQFLDWMNWDNYGGFDFKTKNTSWDLDHIIPTSYAKTKEELIKLNHYSNYQPLCSYDNRMVKKGTVPLCCNIDLNIKTSKNE